MCTVTLSYDKNNATARQQLESLLSTGLFYVRKTPWQRDRVYVEDGEVKLDFVEDETDFEEFRSVLHEMVEREYMDIDYSDPWLYEDHGDLPQLPEGKESYTPEEVLDIIVKDVRKIYEEGDAV